MARVRYFINLLLEVSSDKIGWKFFLKKWNKKLDVETYKLGIYVYAHASGTLSC